MNRFKIATIIAIVSTGFSVLGVCLGALTRSDGRGSTIMLIGGFIGLVAYIFAGLWTAIKMAISIGTWGFRVGPFPVNIGIGLISFMYAVIALVFIPIIPVLRARNRV
jgi:hypothetical protein